MIRINQLTSLLRQAGRFEILYTELNKFFSNNCASRSNNDLMVFGFTGHINDNKVEDTVLIRQDGIWKVFDTLEEIETIKGELEKFSVPYNAIPA